MDPKKYREIQQELNDLEGNWTAGELVAWVRDFKRNSNDDERTEVALTAIYNEDCSEGICLIEPNNEDDESIGIEEVKKTELITLLYADIPLFEDFFIYRAPSLFSKIKNIFFRSGKNVI